tara:strand:- start:407 stop:613 length:207 start_codon:yes stop_codon:yes gene_type:complete
VSNDELKSVQRRLLELQSEHRILDHEVAELSLKPESDQLHLKRLKMRKLRLKDQIAQLKSSLIPDLDA